MTPLPATLFALHLASSLLVFATILPWISPLRSNRARQFALGLLVLLTLLPNLLLASGCVWLRFDHGLRHCPWFATSTAAILQCAGLVTLVRRRATAVGWPRAALAMATVVVVMLEWTTLVNLGLRTQLSAARLELEAGRIAYRERMPRPDAADNAAPVYTQLALELSNADGEMILDAWTEGLRGKVALDTSPAALRAALARCSPALERLRAATRLPRCSFESGADEELVALPPIRPMIDLARALALEARVRVADGHLRAALEDFAAMDRLADHMSEAPVLIGAIAAVAIRSLAFTNLPFALNSRDLGSADLADFDLAPARPACEVYEKAIRMEEAYTLGMLARAVAARKPALSLIVPRVGAAFLRPAVELSQRLHFEDEVVGYRSAMEDARNFCELAAPEVEAAQQKASLARAREDYSRGILATQGAPSVGSVWIPMRRSECERVLARCALAATRFRVEHGAYPTQLEDLPSLPAEVRWQGDAQKARFDCLDPLLKDKAPSIQLD